jgi:hypothetical protein
MRKNHVPRIGLRQEPKKPRGKVQKATPRKPEIKRRRTPYRKTRRTHVNNPTHSPTTPPQEKEREEQDDGHGVEI